MNRLRAANRTLDMVSRGKVPTFKRKRTAVQHAAHGSVTIWMVTTRGYFETGERKGQVNKIIIRDRDYEIYPANTTAYPGKLRENQTAELVNK